MSEVSEVSERESEAEREQSEQGGASERANRRASGPVLQFVFFVDLAHSVPRAVGGGGLKIFNREFKPVGK